MCVGRMEDHYCQENKLSIENSFRDYKIIK